jgi:FMN phosphatase YigB (HAD superfamily)
MRFVFLFDVDNTLLDTDRVTLELREFLTEKIGADEQQHYFALFEQRRAEMGYADYLGALQQYRNLHPHDTASMQVSLFLLNYHFADRLFPCALDAVAHMKTFGTVAILSDGDVVFQPYKIENAGLWNAFDGNVLIYIHKEEELDAVEDQFPAQHYVMVDDKLRILDAMKRVWGSRLTTVFVRQGHYAHDPKHLNGFMPADVTLEQIGDLVQYDGETLLGLARGN